MALKLKPGTELLFIIRQDERGFVLLQRVRVGKTEAKRKGVPARRFTSEAELAIGLWEIAGRWLARIGLAKTR